MSTTSAVLAGEALWAVLEGDCVTLDLPLGSLDAVVSDPPAGIGFMGKDWDHHKGGRDSWIAWMAERMRVALRLLKPGGHAVVWALPRTSHWTATAVEDAGFEVRDVLTHHFGSGFPKNGKVSLKPASEHWILARKPLIGTVAANVLAHGTGGINVDACRVGTSKDVPASVSRSRGSSFAGSVDGSLRNQDGTEGGFDPTLGRWPTNLLLSHGEGCREVGTRDVAGDARHGGDGTRDGGFGDIGATGGNGRPVGRLYGTETVPAWVCAPDCPVTELDRQSGTLTSGRLPAGTRRTTEGGYSGGMPKIAALQEFGGDSGGASRFYPTFRYVPKAPRSMREAGLVAAEGERANDHPTVKHDDLMRWLVRLVTPPGGVVLDMFMGSGSTGRGAILEGCRFIGIDAEAHYVEIAKARIKDTEPKPERQLSLF